MVPLVVMLVATVVARVAGVVIADPLNSWQEATRLGLAAMFMFTAVTHFGPMRRDFVQMVPPWLPAPALLVAVTGVAELVGGVGLLFSQTRSWAALALAALLVVMAPANVHAARARLTIGGRPAAPLSWRLPLQLVWMLLLLWVGGWLRVDEN